jgi:hypothetical protein
MPKRATQAAIDALRNAIDPEAFKAELDRMRAELLNNAASILVRLDLNNASPNLDDQERALGNAQLEQTLVEIQWRIEALATRIGEFDTSKSQFKRPIDRPFLGAVNRATRRAGKKAGISEEAYRNIAEEEE